MPSDHQGAIGTQKEAIAGLSPRSIIHAMPRAKKIPAPPVEAIPAVEPVAVVQPTSPAVLALQDQIVSLVKERDAGRAAVSSAQMRVSVAQGKMHSAQAVLQGTTSNLTRLEQEVQYRIGLIAQIEGRAPQASTHNLQDYGQAPNITTFPMPQFQAVQGDGDMVNRGHADMFRTAI